MIKLFEEKYEREYLPGEDRKLFHSDVSKLLFLAKRAKMSCLNRTVEDKKKLDIVFSYVATSRAQIMKFTLHDGDINPVAYVDASHANQPDNGKNAQDGYPAKNYGLCYWSMVSETEGSSIRRW